MKQQEKRASQHLRSCWKTEVRSVVRARINSVSHILTNRSIFICFKAAPTRQHATSLSGASNRGAGWRRFVYVLLWDQLMVGWAGGCGFTAHWRRVCGGSNVSSHTCCYRNLNPQSFITKSVTDLVINLWQTRCHNYIENQFKCRN